MSANSAFSPYSTNVRPPGGGGKYFVEVPYASLLMERAHLKTEKMNTKTMHAVAQINVSDQNNTATAMAGKVKDNRVIEAIACANRALPLSVFIRASNSKW